MGLRNIEGVVLRLRDLGEADRLVTLFGPAIGRRTGVARGARRLRSRLAGPLQPLHHVRISVFERQGRELLAIDHVDVLERFEGLRSDLDRLLAGMGVLAVVDGLVAEGEPAPALYDLLLRTLRALAGPGDPRPLALAFRARFLAYSGYSLRLDRCVQCGREAAGRLVPARGGLVCPRCGGGEPAGANALELLRQLLAGSMEETGRLDPAAAVLAEAERMLDEAFAYHFE